MKAILTSAVVIIAVLSLAAVGTYADFNDYEVSEDNYVEMGSLDLQLGDTVPYPPFVSTGPYSVPDEDYGEDPLGDSVVGTWDRLLGYPAGMLPGQALSSRVKMRNVGSLLSSEIQILCHNENYPGPYNGPTDKDTKMIITYFHFYGGGAYKIIDLKQELMDITGKSVVTLDDLEHNPLTITDPRLSEADAWVDMSVTFDSTTPFGPPDGSVTYQGTMTNMTLTFVLVKSGP